MFRYLFGFVPVIAFLIAALPSNPARAQDSTLQLQLSLHRMQEWLGSGQNSDNWRKFLQLGDLEALSAMGLHANPDRLSEIANLFGSGAPGLDHPHFSSVRFSIERQIAQIQAGKRGPILIDEANGFVTITDQQLQEATTALRVEIELLKQHFYETLWGIDRPRIMRQLQVNEFIDLLNSIDFLDAGSDVPGDARYDQRQRKILLLARTLRALQPTYRIASSQIGNFYLQLVEHRIDYLERLCTYGFDSNQSQRIYQVSLAGFNEQVDNLSDYADRRAQLLVSQGLGWLYQLGQSPDVISAIRQTYSKPNFKLTVSESLANRFASQRPVRDVRWVDEVVLDNRVQGFAHTNGSISVDFIEHPYQARIDVNLQGTIRADSKTKKGPVTGYSTSFAQFSGHRPLIANVGGLLAFEPSASANLSSDFLGTDCSLNLVNRIAVQQYQERKFRSEQIGSERAEKQIYEQFRDETATEVAKGKASLAEAHLGYFKLVREVSGFRYRVARAGKPEFDETGKLYEPSELVDFIRLPEGRLNTSNSELFVHGFLEDWNRIGAVNDPPQYPFQADVKIQLHESMLANLVAPFVDGRTFQSSEFAKIIESFSGEVPPEFELDGEDEFTITFERGQPIQFAFENQQIAIIINGSNFRKDRNDTGPMYVRFNFQIVQVGNELKMIQDGPAKIDFSEPGIRTVDQITARTLIQDQLDALSEKDPFEQAIDLPANLIPIKLLDEIEGFEGKQEVQKFRLVQARSEYGWLSLGWSYNPQSLAMDFPVQGYLMDTPVIKIIDGPTTTGDDFIVAPENTP